MATPLTDAINALTTYANTVTGASDTTLSDAVGTLCDGYGGGGTSPFAKLYDVTLTEDVRAIDITLESTWMSTYDVLMITLNGEQTSADWIYWWVNGQSSSNNWYGKQKNPFVFNYYFERGYDNKASILYYGKNGYYEEASSFQSSTRQFSWFTSFRVYGYSKDIKEGSKLTVLGAKYADL